MELTLSKIHNMPQIDGNILLLCQRQNEFRTVVTAGGGIEYHIGTVADQQQGLGAAG